MAHSVGIGLLDAPFDFKTRSPRMPMTGRQAASHCHVTLWEIRRATSAGELKSKRWGNSEMWKKADLDRWMRTRPPDDDPKNAA
jgi:hypothetical protein